MLFDLRPYQTEARDQILAAFADGCTDVYLDAPTGSGKTIIAYAVHEALQAANPLARSLYIPADKVLQRQFNDSFPDTPLLMGHGTYCENPDACTSKDTTPCDDCEDRLFSRAGYVMHRIRYHDTNPLNPELTKICEHASRRFIADSSPLANLNPWKYLYELPNYFSDRTLVIIDEADSLDSAVDDYLDRPIALSTLEKYGWTPPPNTATTQDVLHILRACYSDAAARYLAAQEAPEDPTDTTAHPGDDPKTLRAHINQITEFGLLVSEEDHNHNAVLFWDTDNLTLRLIAPAQALRAHAWSRSRHRLHMTGSFGADPLKWAAHMGLPTTPDRACIVRVPHQFPIENRLVHVLPTETMNYQAWSDPDKLAHLASQIQQLHAQHGSPRTLVHVTSKAQARALADLLPAAITYTENTRTSNKNQALQELARRPHSILIAHSCHRGVDLKDDLCRLNIVAKVPFSSLDRSTRARQSQDPAYYAWKTASTLVQSLGRGVRAPDDFCASYVLDATLSFDNWSGRQVLMQFPDWIREALRS